MWVFRGEVDNLFHTVDFSIATSSLISTVHMVLILIMVSMLTLGERKIMGIVQRRVGPNVNGYHGLLQPFADGLKLVVKEIVVPYKADKFVFFVAPVMFLAVSLTMWAVVPYELGVVVADLRYGVLVLFMLSSLTVYGIIFSGWASNSKYPFLGAIRSAAQMISYEISLGLVLIIIVLCTSSFNLTDIILYQEDGWLIFPLLPVFFIFFISALAETNRAPFDLPESESELVAGYNVEYSSIIFAMFFLGEYSNLIIMAILISLFFLGGWLGIFFASVNFAIKISFILILFIVIRAVLPRYRYDQLMSIGWSIFLPLALGYLFFTIGVLKYYDAFVGNGWATLLTHFSLPHLLILEPPAVPGMVELDYAYHEVVYDLLGNDPSSAMNLQESMIRVWLPEYFEEVKSIEHGVPVDLSPPGSSCLTCHSGECE
jgi:NADH-quinone oxidoreductase subunit H